MEIIATIFSVLFIGLVLATAMTFGFALLLWFVGIATIMAVLMFARGAWQRWWFIHNASKPSHDVIEGEYKDISEE